MECKANIFRGVLLSLHSAFLAFSLKRMTNHRLIRKGIERIENRIEKASFFSKNLCREITLKYDPLLF